MASEYLGFISDNDFLNHVRRMMGRLTRTIDLASFEKNVIDPIKLLFSAKAYNQTIEEVIRVEVARQLGKTMENMIGAFHQDIFRYVKGCEVPEDGVDVLCPGRQIYAELKNKHNTMNSSSAEKVFEKLKGIVVGNPRATAYLVEVIAKQSQDIPWAVPGAQLQKGKAERVRRISIDRFYQLITGDDMAFCKLCKALGPAIDKVLETTPSMEMKDTVLQELKARDANILRGIFKTTFSSYLGFETFGR